jgi:DNA-binding NarL/FixJ family response regulator
MQSRTLIIVSADRLYAEAAATYLEGREGWRVAFVSMDGLRALDAARRINPSAVLVIGEPNRIGSRALSRRLLRRGEALHVVLVGVSAESGLPSLSADVAAASVMKALRDGGGTSARLQPPAEDEGVAKLSTLTTRERRILRLVASGASLSEVSQGLKVSEHTIRTHLQNLYTKLGIHSRVQLIRFADRYGLSARTPDGGQTSHR